MADVPENDEGEVSGGTYCSLPDEAAVIRAEELEAVDDRLRQSALQRRSVAGLHVLHYTVSATSTITQTARSAEEVWRAHTLARRPNK